MKPSKVSFCWWCGRKLQGSHHKIIHYEGHDRVCHKWCANALENGREDDFVRRDDELLEERGKDKA